jgi:hypothetical protein
MNLTRFLRKNMNKMLWVLIILIAGAFGITGTMTDVFRQWLGSSSVGKVFGRAVYPGEFTDTRAKLQIERRGQEISEDDVWERIALLEEAKRCSIEVSSEEVYDNILRAYKFLKLRDAVLSTSKDREESARRFRELSELSENQVRQRLDAIQFDASEYARLIDTYIRCSVAEYEEIVREDLILSKLQSFVRGCAKMSTKRLYEEFIKADHKRRIEYTAISSSSFKDKVEVSDSRLKEYYESNKDRYKQPDKMAFEYVMARLDQFKKGIPEPKEDELKAFYQKQRNTDFRRPPHEIPQPAEPEDVYRPYEEVRMEVYSHLLDEKAKEVADKTLKELKAELDKEAQLPFEKVQEIAKKFNLQAKETEMFEQNEFPYKFETEFGECQEVDTMFSRKDEIPALAKGKYSSPAECEHGLFLYRPSKFTAQHIPPFENVREDVKTGLVREEAGKLAEQKAKEFAKEIKEQKEITHPLLLKYNTYSAVTDFFSAINREGRIPSIADDYKVVVSAFAMKDVGEVSDTIDVQSMGDQIFYIIKYLERKDPTLKEFKEKRLTLVYQAQQSEAGLLSKEWENDLKIRARITPVKEKRPPTPAPPVKEEEPSL